MQYYAETAAGSQQDQGGCWINGLQTVVVGLRPCSLCEVPS